MWKYDLKKDTVSGVKLKSCLNLCRSLLCDIVSYALDRSMYIASVGLLWNLCLCRSLRMVWSANVVLELGLKAYCVRDMMLYFVRCVISCLLMIVSSVFAIIGRREMGR